MGNFAIQPIVGKVMGKNESGIASPLPGASVFFSDSSGKKNGGSVTAGADGRFILMSSLAEKSPVGGSITATKDGFETKTVKMPLGNTILITLAKPTSAGAGNGGAIPIGSAGSLVEKFKSNKILWIGAGILVIFLVYYFFIKKSK